MVPSKATLRQLNNTFDLNVLILESSSSVLLFAQLLLQIKNTCLPSHWTERKGNQKATQLIAKLVGVDLTIKLFWIKESHQTKKHDSKYDDHSLSGLLPLGNPENKSYILSSNNTENNNIPEIMYYVRLKRIIHLLSC